MQYRSQIDVIDLLVTVLKTDLLNPHHNALDYKFEINLILEHINKKRVTIAETLTRSSSFIIM